jgi:hypothetical protein
MPFQLKRVGSNTTALFTLGDLLALLGDAVNDEIVFAGQSYRISSCQELGGMAGGAGTADWLSVTLLVVEVGQTDFALPSGVADPESLFLTVNNVVYEYGLQQSYHVEGSMLFWHGPMALEPADRVILRYPSAVN